MDADGSVTHWIQDVKQGDQQAARAIWDRYFTRMVRLANGKLNAGGRAGVVQDGSDVALSAFDSLFGGLRDGKFDQLADREDLWKLLVVITARKAYDEIERASAEKRGGGRVVHETALKGRDDGDGGPAGFDAMVGGGPNPAFTAMVVEQCRRLLAALPDDECRDIALWRMEGYNRHEIADRLECSTRKVAYRLEHIRKIWETLES